MKLFTKDLRRAMSMRLALPSLLFALVPVTTFHVILPGAWARESVGNLDTMVQGKQYIMFIQKVGNTKYCSGTVPVKCGETGPEPER